MIPHSDGSDAKVPGQMNIVTAKPTISEILAEYLADEKERVAARTLSKYEDVVELLKHSLNGYAYSGLEKAERTLWEKHFNADGDAHKEFLNYFMAHKVVAGVDLLRTSGTVIKKLARWLAEHGYVAIEDAALVVEQGAGAARDLPAAAKLATLLYDLTTARFAPRDSDIEGRFGITKVEPRRCTAPGSLDNRLHYAAPGRFWSSHLRRVAAGLR
jgi:hypothetical protein